MRPTILVTGATGRTGLATARQLLTHQYPVRAMVHRRDSRSDALTRLGAEVIVGSLDELGSLEAAMKGVQRAYFCPPLAPGVLRRATFFASAAVESKLEAVVVLSQWLTDPHHLAIHSTEKWLAARVFEWSRLDVVTLIPGWFADNYLAALEPMVQFGTFGMPLGEGLNAPPSNEDLGRVIASALMTPAAHVGKTYRPTGPELLSPHDIAATFGRVLGRSVKYQDAPLGLFLKVAKASGLPEYTILQLHSFLRDYQRGSFGVGGPTTTVLDVSGSPPEDFETTVRRALQGSSLLRRSLGSRLRALGNVVRALLTTAPDLDAVRSRLELPLVGHAMLAADSARWMQSHSPGGAPRDARPSPSSGAAAR